MFLRHNFNDFIEKELCTKFCGVLIISHKVKCLTSSRGNKTHEKIFWGPNLGQNRIQN